MGLFVTGYVLDPTRVGQGNSPFTATPNIVISDQSAFDAAYPSDESAPRTEYLVFVLTDGKLTEAVFGWTKNEVLNRFDYNGQESRFQPLVGAALIEIGALASDSNIDRLTSPVPIDTDLVSYPMRISLGTGSGTTFTIDLVANDAALDPPPAASGTVKLSLESGKLGWATADLTSYEGQDVRVQRQTFYQIDQSASIGDVADPLLLNPLPATGQSPLVRLGFGEYLTAVEKANEVAFSPDPTAGTVEWAVDTGRLKFNSGPADLPVYYDGALMAADLTVPTESVGTVDTPLALSSIPSEDSDVYFRSPGVVQFPQTQFVDALSSGKAGVVQIERVTGNVGPSAADQSEYAGDALQAVLPDVLIERGMSLRLFRSPVDPGATDSTVKDVASLYETEGALLADPIIAVPQVFLPAIPVDTQPFTVEVLQGTGSFTPGILPRLDVASPPVGYGYVINFEDRLLQYARRQEDVVLEAPTSYGVVQLPNPLVFESNLLLELENTPGGGIYTPLVLGTDALISYPPGLVTLVETDGSFVISGSVASISGTTFTDTSQNFTLASAPLPVVPGDLLVVTAGAAEGVYTISTVASDTLGLAESYTGSETGVLYEIRRGKEVLADRYFQEVLPLDPNTKVERIEALGTTANAPRLNINPAFAPLSRFRFGKTTFATLVSLVLDDASFTAPASMSAGQVEISIDTGNLNFSQADVTAGETVYWVRELELGIEYKLQPGLGFIELTERMLELGEIFVTYKDSDGNLIEERGTFLVRKEEVPHAAPTASMTFNPLGRETAGTPAPKVYRGGRPQSASQVTVDVSTNTITFLTSTQVTDALPSGIPVDPVESVYIDYYIYEAFGGENTLSVLQSPMLNVPIQISEGDTSFEMGGDRTSVFPDGYLLRVDNAQVYLISSTSYDAGTDTTTINIVAGTGGFQGFLDDYRNPALAVSSGPTPITGSAPYFQIETATFTSTPRGSSLLRLDGDLTQTYVKGLVVYFDGGAVYTDFNLVDGSVYDADTNRTEVTFASNGSRQYTYAPGLLKRSLRAVLDTPSAQGNTARAPILTEPTPDEPVFQGSLVTVFRKVAGEPGVILTEGVDYTIDGSGRVEFVDPLGPGEELSIIYTGTRVVEAGRRFRVSYTYGIAPDETVNGLLNQVLQMDYTAYLPDSFFWRVETFTNFRGELETQYQQDAKASVPSGGPILENSAAPRLYEQGVESVFYAEGYLSNEDIVARATLKLYNDVINYLEDVLQDMDGRVVGDQDGRFLYDGDIDNPDRATFDTVTNQIDDRFKISPAPYSFSYPPLSLTSIGTYQEVYKAAPTSRFYPTQRYIATGVEYTGTPNTGTVIGPIGYENVTGVTGIEKRWPWASVTETADVGDTDLTVDFAEGGSDLLRPEFSTGDVVAVYAADRTTQLVAPVAVVSVPDATTIRLPALAVKVPKGSSVVLDVSDTNYRDKYAAGLDIGVDAELGLLTYLNFTGSPITNNPPPTGTLLDLYAGVPATSTSPERFPALDGLTTDDDGNRGLPPYNPSPDSEVGGSAQTGYLHVEQAVVESGGRLRSQTQAPFLGVGYLDPLGETLTLTSPATFPTTPNPGDLVRILDGPAINTTNFRRVLSATASSVTVASGDAYTTASGLNFTVTLCSSSLQTGTTATTTVNPATTLTDTAAIFQTNNVKPGMTVVFTTAGKQERRQITAVVSEQVLEIEAVSWAVPGTSNYRVDNPLSTFGGTNSATQEIVQAIAGEQEVLSYNAPPGPWSERYALSKYLDDVFTYIYSLYSGSVSGSTLTDTAATFIDDASPGDYIYIKSGANAGIYVVDSITSQTELEIDGTFPSGGTVFFYLASTILASRSSLEAVDTAQSNIDEFLVQTTAWNLTVGNQVSVLGDAGAFALGWQTADLDNRVGELATRLTNVGNDSAALESIVAATDRLYDKRYVWIDARINLETGIIVRKERAQEDREKNNEKTLKSLTKLLTT